MRELMTNYSTGQVMFFLFLKLSLLGFALYAVWQLRKAQGRS